MALTPARRVILVLWLLGIAGSAVFPPWRQLDTEHGHLLGPTARHLIFENRYELTPAYPYGPPRRVRVPVQETVDWRRLPLEWIGTTAVAAAAFLIVAGFGKRKPLDAGG